ncbi:MAG: hypothetical protein R3175_11310 [Marinobacter sp.]|uniref:hypothetical protein n=1 Tax=Marinobacter sp. TaxID=50741 RepID=UPI00299F2D08|nr:hypothetical protein [Marinobacter sp.]MDX1756639.1 hypothetical protein [Marinobacter sp.]
MRQVIDKAISALSQRKSRTARYDQKPGVNSASQVKSAEWDMSPEDALRVGTVAGYK